MEWLQEVVVQLFEAGVAEAAYRDRWGAVMEWLSYQQAAALNRYRSGLIRGRW